MTHRAERTLVTRGLARVEGEGAMYIRVGAGQVEEVRLDIYEPPRFFEAFLRGRSFTEPPDITARICGICPVAYQTSACQAIEEACGVTLSGPLADLRRLLYCGEWISSHALHIYMLHAPDFLGYPGAVELARDHRDIVERGLALRRTANAIMATLGGRSIHPVNVRSAASTGCRQTRDEQRNVHRADRRRCSAPIRPHRTFAARAQRARCSRHLDPRWCTRQINQAIAGAEPCSQARKLATAVRSRSGGRC